MFDDVEVKINNSDEKRPQVDYSQFKFQNGALLAACCIEVKEIKTKQWRKDSSGNSYFVKDAEGKPVLIPGVGFVFEVVDDNGKPCPLLLQTDGKVTYGSMRSKTYKAIKALRPNLPDDYFEGDKEEVKRKVKALFGELAEAVKKTPIFCLVELKVKIYPANPPKYPEEGRRIDISDVKPEPSRRNVATPEEKAADPVANPTGKIGIDTFDDDDIPY